jgi:hypothetical protein
MTFYTGGSERVRIDTSGNMGLGTASPSTKLDVAGTSRYTFNVANAYTLQTSINAAGSAFADDYKNALSHIWQTSGTQRMVIDSSGNVGIGTASPGAKLQIQSGTSPTQPTWAASDVVIAGNSAGNSAFYQSFSDTGGGLVFSTPTTRARSFLLWNENNGNSTWQNGSSGALILNSNGAERMRVGGDGNVGIGTATPATKLTVSSATNAGLLVTDGTVNTIVYNSTGGVGSIGTTSNHPVDFYSNNAARMRITSSGNVGIGTATPAGKFNVASGRSFFGANSETYSIAVGYTQARCNSGQTYYIGATDSATPDLVFSNAAGTERMRIADNGEVIVGITDQGAYNLQCNGTGVWGAGAYVNGSDARLKDDIATLNDGLNVVSQLRPVTFKYKPDYSKDQNVQTGFIAQELQAVLDGKDYVDGIVQAGPNHLNVAYQSLIPILVKAIQELTARVAELEAK